MLWGRAAFAQEDDVQQCAAAYEQAQVFRNAGQLAHAQEQLRVCVREVCPDFVKVDCGQWLSDVKREMPSVVFIADDTAGKELSDVKVTVDGALAQQTLDGRAFELDPGQHDVLFEYQGHSQQQKLIVRQGEKNRVVKITFVIDVDSDQDGILDGADACPNQPGTLADKGCPAQVVAPVASSDAIDPRLIGAYVAWGVGVLGFAGFAYWGLQGNAIGEDGAAACTPSCDDATFNHWKDRESSYLVPANISVAVGGVGAATGLVLFLLSQFDDTPSSATNEADATGHAVRFSATPTAHGAAVTLSGQF